MGGAALRVRGAHLEARVQCSDLLSVKADRQSRLAFPFSSPGGVKFRSL
jgi:hypothetical protein